MKDSEFIELLNLYLDHEISAADATRLEAEVMGNPARRRIYQDYCRMQKGCKLLAHDFTTETGTVEERKVIAFNPAPVSRRRGVYVAGAFAAAAACCVLIFSLRDRPDPAASRPATAQAISNRTDSLVVAGPSSDGRGGMALARSASSTQGALTGALSLRGKASASPSAVFVSGDRGAVQFDWMRTLNLPPVQRVSAEQLRFENRAGMQAESRTYDSGQPLQESVEMSAFRFQR